MSKQKLKLLYSYANKRRAAVMPIDILIGGKGILQHSAKEMAEVLQKKYCSAFKDATDM